MKINGVKVEVDLSLGFGLVVVILEKPANDEQAEKVKALFEKLQGPSGGRKLRDELTSDEARQYPKDRALVFTGDSWRHSVPYYNQIS